MLVSTLDKREEVLAALRRCGDGWHDRATLAKKGFGKAQLNPEQKVALDRLVEDGVIEKSMMAGKQAHVMRIVYCLKG